MEEGPNASSVGFGSPSPPPSDPESAPVGSPEDTVPADLLPPSDDDHEHDQDHDEENEDQSSGAGVLTDDLKHKIIKQVEYYFSDENLPTDKYLMNFIKKNKGGFVPIPVIASFKRMKKLTRDYQSIGAALKDSSLLVVSSDGKKVKRLNPLPFTEVRDPKLFTVLVENLPEDHSLENIRRMFGETGKIKNIRIRDPRAIEESKKASKMEILISSKLHALVEYETVEAAEKAVATLNDEQDWRNGLRVKLLKLVGKYGQRRQAWKAHDSEKNGVGQTSEQTGDKENNNMSEHHDDAPDEEDGDHLHKEKKGQRGRNRGRPRRQKYCVTSGLGHGNTSSSRAIEVSKPPPGPKMPDGTRGFTMGRGRPLNSNESQHVV